MNENETSKFQPPLFLRRLGYLSFRDIIGELQYIALVILLVYNAYNYVESKAVDADTYSPVINATKDCLNSYYNPNVTRAFACDTRIGDIIFSKYEPNRLGLNNSINLKQLIR